MTESAPRPLPDALCVDLLGRLLADRETGTLGSTAQYQALYPGFEPAVADEVHRFLESSPRDATADRALVGTFRLVRELGRGGQGTVWLAVDDRIGRHVALKIVARSPLLEDLAPRFQREARLLGRLDHPGLCPVYDVGSDDAVAWIALRFVEGETLARRLERGPLARDEALRIVEQAARALEFAHASGIVHRDVKPSNVMLAPDGSPVLLDFGVARLVDRADASPEHAALTATGNVVGTVAYLAPELLDGSGTPDARVDVWSLGVVLYEALVGRRPFQGSTQHALMRSIVDDEIELPSTLDADLATVVATALQKDPARRYRSAADFADDLERVRKQLPIHARRTPPWRRLMLFLRREPRLAATLGALAVVVVAALVVTGILLSRTRTTLSALTRLSDQNVASQLLARQDALWPAAPERVAELEAWVAQAKDLLAREPLHRATLQAPPGALGLADTSDAWMRAQIEALLAEFARLSAVVPNVEARIEDARTIDERTIVAPRARWQAAADGVRADPRFDGLVLTPQRGLVPLGADPESRLEEFAVVATGAVPERDPATRHLVLDEHSACVLVLVPGGRVRIGADASFDPWTQTWDGPAHEVRLDPFFIAKHELTQGQWLRHAGENPAIFQRGSGLPDGPLALMHPVENVRWDDCDRFVEQLGLRLPTESQWERAARAGTTTPWWTGDRPETLDGAANLADRFAKANGGSAEWRYDEFLDDGFTNHAPVGTYRANAFGLHDVAGNVNEWCDGRWEDYAKVAPRDGDGLIDGNEIDSTFRGGSYFEPASASRVAFRRGNPRYYRSFVVGVRVARDLTR